MSSGTGSATSQKVGMA